MQRIIRGNMAYLIGLIALLLPTYLIRFEVAQIPTTLLELLIYVVFIIGLANMGYTQWKRAKTSLWLPVGIFLAGALISTYIAPDKLVALGQLKAFFIDPILVLYLIVVYLKEKDIKTITCGLILSTVVVSAYSIITAFVGNFTVDGRIVGLFGYSPNYAALYLTPLLVLTFTQGYQEYFLKKKPIYLIFYSAIFILGVAALALSQSRAGFLGLTFGIGLFLFIKNFALLKRKKIYLIALSVLAILALAFLIYFIRPDLSPNVENKRVATSNNIRYLIWLTSFEMASKNPILGVGLGNYQNYFTELTKDRVNFPEYIAPWALTPHNIFLMVYLTTGLAGLVGFIYLLIWYFTVLVKAKTKFKLALVCTMGALLVQGLLDTPYFKNDLALIFFLLIGTAYLAPKGEND